MTMLTHSHGALGRLADASRVAAPAKAQGAAHLDAVKRFFAGVVAALLATAALVGAIALKGAYLLSHFSH